MSVRALGVTQARWVHDYFRIRPRLTPEELRPLVEAGRLLPVRVRGWATPGFVHRDHAPLLRRAAAGNQGDPHRAPLALRPGGLGPGAGARHVRLRLPPGARRAGRKRRHGDFAPPILRRGALVGRLDAKATGPEASSR